MPKNKTEEFKTGTVFHRLTVLHLHHKDKRWRRYYMCECECGEQVVIHGAAMKSGNTKSCGCLSAEVKAKRISRNHSDVTAIILGYKRHAKGRGFEWGLSRTFVEKIIQQDCFYCGGEPSNTKKTKNSLGDGLKYSGIDRIDSGKNYTEDNVVPCCKICNYAKSNMTVEEFKRWAIRIGKKAMVGQWA